MRSFCSRLCYLSNDDTDADSQVYESSPESINQKEIMGCSCTENTVNWLGSRFLRHTILIRAREEISANLHPCSNDSV